MSLSNLTTSGWVLFAIWLVFALVLVINLIRRAKPSLDDVIAFAVTTAWLLWLVTP